MLAGTFQIKWLINKWKICDTLIVIKCMVLTVPLCLSTLAVGW